MPGPKTHSESKRISDEAVKDKTGRVWKDWFAILDKAGAKKMTHREIARLMTSEHGLPPWWGQMVAVTYEQERGLRQKHERPDGYQVSVSRTLPLSLAKLFHLFADEDERDSWLGESGLMVRKATKNKTLRVTWKDNKSSLEIYFYAKPKDKSQVVVQHTKLSTEQAAARMKQYWAKALDRLAARID